MADDKVTRRIMVHPSTLEGRDWNEVFHEVFADWINVIEQDWIIREPEFSWRQVDVPFGSPGYGIETTCVITKLCQVEPMDEPVDEIAEARKMLEETLDEFQTLIDVIKQQEQQYGRNAYAMFAPSGQPLLFDLLKEKSKLVRAIAELASFEMPEQVAAHWGDSIEPVEVTAGYEKALEYMRAQLGPIGPQAAYRGFGRAYRVNLIHFAFPDEKPLCGIDRELFERETIRTTDDASEATCFQCEAIIKEKEL